jgi:hypothetical protein
VALSRHLPVIGSGGLLLLAKDQQLIPEVRPLLDALVAAGLRIHPQLYHAILRSAGE